MEETTSENFHLQPCRCPNININISDVATFALIEPGSEVTAISEEFYEANEELKSCPKLPLNGKIVRGALGSRSTLVKFQILCPVKVGKLTEEIIFLIIPKLGKNCIIGYDTIKDLSIMIDPITEVVNFRKAGKTVKLAQPEAETIKDCN